MVGGRVGSACYPVPLDTETRFRSGVSIHPSSMSATIKSGCLALVLVFAAVSSALAQGPKRIQLAQVEAMFSEMRARAPWNVDGPLLWGYFFFDSDRGRLERAATELSAAGYKVVEIHQVPGKPSFRLHVERVEKHTPEMLDARNQEFYSFAARHSIASYDGMDVGPVLGSSK